MSIVDWIYPKICVGCGMGGKYICDNCALSLNKPSAICPECAQASISGWVHLRCKTKYGMDRLLVGLSYKGLVQLVLKKVKYKSAWDTIPNLFDVWKESIRNEQLFLDNSIVTCVPMYSLKQRERGFNQAEELAKLISNHYKLPYKILLKRVKVTKPMFGLSKEERIQNVNMAFEFVEQSKEGEIKNSKVIIVDDVWTTGATMRECARILKMHGFKEVWGMVLAR